MQTGCSPRLPSPERAEPTTITVRAIAKGAKFVGTSMGGVSITIRDTLTGALLAQGVTQGTTGDTAKIMTTPHKRGEGIATPDAAHFTATVDITEPRLVEISAYGPLAQRQAAARVSITHRLRPGQAITGGVNPFAAAACPTRQAVPQKREHTDRRTSQAPDDPAQDRRIARCPCRGRGRSSEHGRWCQLEQGQQVDERRHAWQPRASLDAAVELHGDAERAGDLRLLPFPGAASVSHALAHVLRQRLFIYCDHSRTTCLNIASAGKPS